VSVVAATDEKTDATTVAIVASDEIAGWSTPHEPTTTPCAHGGSTPFKPTSRVRTEPCFTRLSPPYRGNDHSVLSLSTVHRSRQSCDRPIGWSGRARTSSWLNAVSRSTGERRGFPDGERSDASGRRMLLLEAVN